MHVRSGERRAISPDKARQYYYRGKQGWIWFRSWKLQLLCMLRLLCLGLIAANRLNRIIVNLGPLPIVPTLPTE